MSRATLIDPLLAAGCVPVGFEWCGDDLLERAVAAWRVAGAPRGYRVGVEHGRAICEPRGPILTDLD